VLANHGHAIQQALDVIDIKHLDRVGDAGPLEPAAEVPRIKRSLVDRVERRRRLWVFRIPRRLPVKERR
jgi:hypothetical protein